MVMEPTKPSGIVVNFGCSVALQLHGTHNPGMRDRAVPLDPRDPYHSDAAPSFMDE